VKLVFIVVDQALEPDLSGVFQELDIEHWTSWSNVHGAGRTGTKRGSPIWPGLNTLYLALLPPERVQPLVDRLLQVRDSFPKRPGLKVFSLEAEALT